MKRPRCPRGWAGLALLLLALSATGCAGRKKAAADALASLSAEQVYQRGLELLAKRELRRAISVLERIQYDTPESREIEPLAQLARADATFYQLGDLPLIEARGLYVNFVTFFGNHPMAPYAQLQAGFCSLKQVRHPSRDQSQTREALIDLREVVQRYPDSHYVNAARTLIRQAEANLAQHDFDIGRFYAKRKDYAAAAARFRNVLEAYPDYLERERVYFLLGQVLLETDDAEGRVYLNRLLEEYPNGVYAEEARKALVAAGADPVHQAQGASQ